MATFGRPSTARFSPAVSAYRCSPNVCAEHPDQRTVVLFGPVFVLPMVRRKLYVEYAKNIAKRYLSAMMHPVHPVVDRDESF